MERRVQKRLAGLALGAAALLGGCVAGSGAPPARVTCGDQVCADSESCSSCAADCGPCPRVCGDRICHPSENCICFEDCGECSDPCGDGSCLGGETCQLCPADCGACPPLTWYWLSDLTWSSATNAWGPVERDTSNGEDAAGDGSVLSVGGAAFNKGLGVHAPSEIRFALGEACTQMTATVGIDDETGVLGSVRFEVQGDGFQLFDSGPMAPGAATDVDVDVSGVGELLLAVSDAGDGTSSDHADWAMAQVGCTAAPPAAAAP